MKIVFLCGALEPGYDGVGDYTRRLAGELIRQGHEVAMVSLNDQYISDELVCTQHAENVPMPVLRLPANWSASRRFSEARKWIEILNPQWISLQFVPFSFHPKGLPFGLSNQLLSIGREKQWHIMFHELWVGMNIEAPLKLVCWGRVQKLLIKSLLNTVRPRIINTQTNVYLEQLTALGFKGSQLPLYTNIPIVAAKNNTTSLENGSAKINNTIKLVLFGSIHPGVPVEEFVKEIIQYAAKNDVRFSLTIIGRAGKEQEHWGAVWKTTGFAAHVLGEQSPEYISTVLKTVSIGLSTTPVALAEKSGSIAAMSRHGLPVICISQPWHPRGLHSLQPLRGIFEYRQGNLEKYFAEKRYAAITYDVSEISSQFAESLLSVNQEVKKMYA